MKHLFLFAVAFPLMAFGQVGSINVPLMLGTNATPVSHPGFFATNAAAIASAVAPVISLDAGRIISGVLPISRIATGTPTGTKFVRDDGTLATPAGGGGGSNFITSVSADFQVLLESLSLTNTAGTGQLLRASTLSSYLLSATASTLYQPLDPDLSDLADGSLTGSKVGPGVDAGNITTGTLGDARIPATIARLDSPQFTGTVGFEFLQADTVQVPWASRYATANGSSNLVGTLDGGSWTNLNGTEIRSGTVADARIDSAIARDSEVAAGYQPLDADLTALAAGTAMATAITNAASVGAPSLIVGSTNVAVAIAAKAPIASPAFTTSATIGGTNVLDYAATHLTEAEASALYQRTNTLQNVKNGAVWSDGFVSSSGALIFGYPFSGAAISGGSSVSNTGLTNNPGVSSINAAAGANSGYAWYTSTSIFDISGRGPEFTSIVAFPATNNVVSRNGFGDTITATEVSDGAYVKQENGFLRGVVFNNGSATYTVSSNQIAPSSTTFFRVITRCNNDGSGATFWVLSALGPDTYATNWTDSVTAALPSGTSRLTGATVLAFDTAGSAGKELLRVDAMGIDFTQPLIR